MNEVSTTVHPVITIGRQLGSGGFLVAKILSNRLAIPFFDKELITLAAQESGLRKEFFEKADEKNSFSIFGNFIGATFGNMQDSNYLSNETLFKIQSDVIRNIAQKGSCIFVGRCADYILRNNPNLLSVFISANIEDRIKMLVKEKNVSPKEAKRLTEQADKKRSAYYNYYSNKVWGTATCYDICVNTSALGLGKTTDLLFEIFSYKFKRS
ncbi:MAG: cytidylate kinase-like family protein [Prevotellaceae bacterium]|jgi:cytidylate kinase|nr:cytidylate kinase-like family protein [Prevotellaceae bacterium]